MTTRLVKEPAPAARAAGEPPPEQSVALLFDVHGNVAALEAVLADLATQPVDRVLLGGDYATHGPRPRETVERLMALEAPGVVGNTDRYLVDAADRPFVPWAREQLEPRHLDWLAAFPFAQRIDDLFVVHATPTDVEAVLFLEPPPYGDHPATPEEEALTLVGDARADLIVAGHLHYAAAGTVGGQRLATIGSIGFPFDGDPRAAYAIARRTADGWQVEHRRVAYDHEAVAAELDAIDASFAANSAERIRRSKPIDF